MLALLLLSSRAGYISSGGLHRPAARAGSRSRSLSGVRAREVPLQAAPTTFSGSVETWLRSEGFQTRRGCPRIGACEARPLLLVRGPSSTLVLHLLPSPQGAAEVLPASASAELSDGFAARRRKGSRHSRLVHLWEDQWLEHQSLVRSRLLSTLGFYTRRVFARQTSARRIDAATLDIFLLENHLWGPTKARYRYGLYDKAGELVAVASFSSRWNMKRHGVSRASHELIRYCSRRGESVTGGISKLITAFRREASPDEIVTVIDRDWGSGDGWSTLGFSPLRRLPPVPFLIGPDGLRRHPGRGPNPHRRRLPPELLAEVEALESPEEAAALLTSRGFYNVHDAGAERHLLVLTPEPEAVRDGRDRDARLELRIGTGAPAAVE